MCVILILLPPTHFSYDLICIAGYSSGVSSGVAHNGPAANGVANGAANLGSANASDEGVEYGQANGIRSGANRDTDSGLHTSRSPGAVGRSGSAYMRLDRNIVV